MSRTLVVLAAVVACGKDAPPPPIEIPADKAGLIWIAPAGEGGEEDLRVAIDAAGTVFYAGRLRGSQRVEGQGRPSRTKEHRDALYVAGRDIKARKGWVRPATANVSYPRPAGLAAIGGGRVALAVEHAEALDWGKGPMNRPKPDRDAGDLEQFRATSDHFGSLDFGVYVVGGATADIAIASAMHGDATHVVSDGSGAFVLAGDGWGRDLAPAWRKVDAAACAEDVESVDVLRWRDTATPDWAACLTATGKPHVGDIEIAADGDVVVCIDVQTVSKTNDDDDDGGGDGEETWSAQLLRLDGTTGKTLWSVALPLHDGQASCDNIATTASGHVVVGQEALRELVVFDGKQAPSLDKPSAIRGTTFARGLRPTTIAVVAGDEIQEIDVVTGAVAWSYPIPRAINVDTIAAAAGMVAIAGSYSDAFDGGAAGKLPAVDERDLGGYVMVVRAPITP